MVHFHPSIGVHAHSQEEVKFFLDETVERSSGTPAAAFLSQSFTWSRVCVCVGGGEPQASDL